MSGIKIPVSAEFDKGSVDTELQQLVNEFNKVGQAVAKANKIKFNPLDVKSTTWATFDKMGAGLEKLTSQSKKLRDELARTGQSHLMAHEIDFNRLTGYSGRSIPSLQKTVLSQAINGTGAGFQYAAGQQNASGSGAGAQGRRIVGAGLSAMGGAGGVANNALSAGMSGGIGAGLAGLGGGLAALAIGKAIGAVTQKIGSAEDELVQVDKFKRMLGDVGVGFNALKESLRSASYQIGVTFDEGQKLGLQYTKVSGLSGTNSPMELNEAVNTAGGFSRSFGMDRSQGVDFFGRMRLTGAAKDDQQARRLALLIGDGIGKSGAFSKADEVLEAIAGYTTGQTRSGMNTANTEAFNAMLSGMIGSKIPGMDVGNASAILGRANSAIAGGGAAGEAGQNFIYAALGGRGMDPMDVALLQEQGIFGTGRKTFGAGSVGGSYYQARGIALPDAADSDVTNFERLQQHFQKTYGGGPQMQKLMANAMANLYGLNNTQSMALSSIKPAELGGLGRRLDRLGINVKDVNASGISSMAQIEGDTSMSETAKDQAIRKAAETGQESTDGKNIEQSKNALENIKQELASKLIPLTQASRDALLFLAGGGKKSTREVIEAMEHAESSDRQNSIRDRFGERQRDELLGIEKARNLPAAERVNKIAEHEENLKKIREEQVSALKAEAHQTQENIRTRIDEDVERKKAIAAMEEARRKHDALVAGSGGAGAGAGAGRGSINPPLVGGGGGSTPVASSSFNADAEAEGLSPEMRRFALAVYGQESGGGADTSTSINGAVGHMQMLPSTFRGYADSGWDINNPSHNRRAAMRYLKDLAKKSGGNLRTAAGAYYGGEKAINPDGSLKTYGNLKRPSDPNTQEYADQVMGRMAGTPIPDMGADARSGDQRVNVTGETTHTVVIQDPRGQQLAPAQRVKVRLAAPQPSGM